MSRTLVHFADMEHWRVVLGEQRRYLKLNCVEEGLRLREGIIVVKLNRGLSFHQIVALMVVVRRQNLERVLLVASCHATMHEVFVAWLSKGLRIS